MVDISLYVFRAMVKKTRGSEGLREEKAAA